MDTAVLFFLTSGLFLGWSLGANDAANVFGTAVGTRMVRFATAAIICSVFVVLGAVISGSGAAHTLGRLGAVNALPGSFMAAFSAALAVYAMTKLGLPVSTTQAIVGGIIGWNLYSQSQTDVSTLSTILSTWIICPVLAAVIAVVLFKIVTHVLKVTRPHLLRTDAYTRLGLLLAGAFGAYSLGANNIANVMGVFVPASPFTDFKLLGGLLPLSPVAAWVVVVSHSLVLFVFASEGLESLLASAGLPTIPLVPVSSSQAVVGAVIGIGMLKGGRTIQWRVLGGVGLGWVATPILAGVVCFVGLFFLQNVFNQTVYRPVPHALSPEVIERLDLEGVETERLRAIEGRVYGSVHEIEVALEALPGIEEEDAAKILAFAEIDVMRVDLSRFARLDRSWMTPAQLTALRAVAGRRFTHKWELAEALAEATPDWRFAEATTTNKVFNKDLRNKLETVYRVFRVEE
jgi:PiT family inorganic phosphate transporter